MENDKLVSDLLRMSEMNSMSLWKRDVCKRAADALSIPAVDAVELVRCGECRWWDQKEGSRYGYCYACRHKFFSSNWEISVLRTYREDFFCADGERKDGDNDAPN